MNKIGGGKLWSVVRTDMNDFITHSAQNGSEFAHYGVKGMKWGVRKEYEPVGRKKGPSAGDYSRYDVSKEKVDAEKRRAEGIKRKEGVTKTITTSGGTSIIHIDGTDDYTKYRQQILDYKNSSPLDYAPESVAMKKFRELPKIDGTSDARDIFSVNNNGPTYERRMNCFECAAAYEMRKRGYDVQANERQGGFAHETLHAFNVKDSFTVASTSTDEAYNRIAGQCLAYGDGARGSIQMYWASGGGHAINWEVKNGKFNLIDVQSGRVSPYESFSACDPGEIRVWRLDNAEVLPGVTDLVEPRVWGKDPFQEELEKMRKSGKSVIKKALKAIKKAGKNVAKYLSKGLDAIAKFFKVSPKETTNKAKDSRSFVEKLFNVETKEKTTSGKGGGYMR